MRAAPLQTAELAPIPVSSATAGNPGIR